MTGKRGTPEQRFFSKVSGGDVETCWLWTACLSPAGYGRFGMPNSEGSWRGTLAHRWSWEFFNGAIPDGLCLDHLCRVRACVNPWHMEPVTSAENLRRGVNANAEITHCPRGHVYSEENTYDYSGTRGGRQCKICVKARSAQARSASR